MQERRREADRARGVLGRAIMAVAQAIVNQRFAPAATPRTGSRVGAIHVGEHRRGYPAEQVTRWLECPGSRAGLEPLPAAWALSFNTARPKAVR